MPQYADSYVLLNSRSRSIMRKFLETFLPRREEMTDEYLIPMYATQPQYTFTNADELMAFLENNPGEEHSIYWRNLDKQEEIKFGMVFYTTDGRIIVGVSTVGKSPSELTVVSSYIRLKNYFNSDTGCITIEEPPPSNSVEFRKFCSNRYVPAE